MKTVTSSLFNIKYVVLVIALAVLLLSSVFMPTHKAKAATDIDVLTAQLQQLIQIVTSLQAQLAVMNGDNETGQEGGFTNKFISYGDRVQTTDTLKVRDRAYTSGALLGVQNPFTSGKVVGGPGNSGGYTWWQIKYDNGILGWSAENWLRVVADDADQEITESLLDKISDYNDQDDDVSINVDTNSDSFTYGDSLKILWTQKGSVPKGSKACVTLRRKTDEKHFAHPATGGACVSIAGKEPTRSVTGEIIRASGFDLTPGEYRAVVIVSGPSNGGKDGAVLAKDKSNYITIRENIVRVDSFTAKVRDNDATYGPYVDLAWKTTGTKSCNLFYNGTHIATRDSNDDYELANTAVTEKYGLPAFGGKANFEIRCQSKYTQKDSTVSEFETVSIDIEETPAVINSFEAILDGRSDKFSPYVFFQWSTSAISSCSIFMEDRVLMTNLSTSGSKLLSRNAVNEKYGVDFKKNNDFELRCQHAYSKKDSTVSEFESVYMGSSFVDSLTAEYKGYMNNRLFITTQDISKIDAYDNCELNAKNNPGAEVRCAWGGDTIYQNYGKG
jgi:type II secretory pathway pseudopilin PulG